MLPTCVGTKTNGEPYGQTLGLDADGLCATHRAGGLERIRAAASRGGRATKAKHAGAAFHADDLPQLETLDDALSYTAMICRAVLTRRITHNESNAAAKAVDSWVKAKQASMTAQLVEELRAELDAKQTEIDGLRQQLASRTPRPMLA
jgi:hypothetical protein